MFDDEYFDEYIDPALIELQGEITKFQQTIADNLKEDIKAKIARADKILASQKTESQRVGRLEAETKFQKRQYEIKLETVEREFRQGKITEIIATVDKMISTPLWHVTNRWIENDIKCNKCSEDGYYELVAPDSSTHRVRCNCQNSVSELYVEQSTTRKINFCKATNYTNQELNMSSCDPIYMQLSLHFDSSEDYGYWEEVAQPNIFKTAIEVIKIKEREYDRAYFTNEQACVDYLDYLNNKNEEG